MSCCVGRPTFRSTSSAGKAARSASRRTSSPSAGGALRGAAPAQRRPRSHRRAGASRGTPSSRVGRRGRRTAARSAAPPARRSTPAAARRRTAPCPRRTARSTPGAPASARLVRPRDPAPGTGSRSKGGMPPLENPPREGRARSPAPSSRAGARFPSCGGPLRAPARPPSAATCPPRSPLRPLTRPLGGTGGRRFSPTATCNSAGRDGRRRPRARRRSDSRPAGWRRR